MGGVLGGILGRPHTSSSSETCYESLTYSFVFIVKFMLCKNDTSANVLCVFNIKYQIVFFKGLRGLRQTIFIFFSGILPLRQGWRHGF